MEFFSLLCVDVYRKLFLASLTVLAICALQITQAQKFTISLPKSKIKNSLYNQIGLYDARKDTLSLGILRFYSNGSPSYVLPEPSLAIQVPAVLHALIDTSASQSELLFHLRDFSFSSHAGMIGETGYCTIRAGLYVRYSKGVYKLLATVDTLIVKKKLGAKNALFNSAEDIFTSLIADNLTKRPIDSTTYSTADIKYIETREKRALPLYYIDTLRDGIYKSYQTFAQQTPDNKVMVSLESDLIKSVKIVNSKGETVEADPAGFYAFVYQGKGYISTEYGYYPIVKKNNDFYYMGKSKTVANGAHVANSQFNYGLVGALVASSENGVYEIKIDHLNGNAIKTKRLDSR